MSRATVGAEAATVGAPTAAALTILGQLRREADPAFRAAMRERFGIRTDRAYGVSLGRLRVIAKPNRGDHDLAAELWATGVHEARILAALIDDPAAVDVDQMNRWCGQFDSWAIVDGTCLHLFDRTPHAWSRIEPWASDDREFVKRAAFALLWALAVHDRSAPDTRFAQALEHVEPQADDPRPLVGKAITMALKAVATRRPGLRAEVVALSEGLVRRGDPHARRAARPVLRALG